MSAYICDDRHISALAVYLERKERSMGDPELTAEKIAAVLHAENVRSVNYRYRESESPDFRFVDSERARQYSAVQIIKAAQCFDYQACETDDYSDTRAAKMVKAIIAYAIQDLPGYEAATWGIPEPLPYEARRLGLVK